jgi:hypothetical protein
MSAVTFSKSLLILLIVFCLNETAKASSGTANGTGNWGNPSSWLINGTARVPTCGDTVTIPVGVTITVNSQQIYGCTTPIVIIVRGTLQFTTGNKLDLPCGSLVDVVAGGTVLPGNGSGNSNYISICNTVYWNASSGPLSGPLALGGAPLPIKLLSFDATVQTSSILISWSTATETNNDFFTIQRSVNGESWSDILQVQGAGNSSLTLNYSIEDSYPLKGLSYYRLKQTDYDGTVSFSPAVAVVFAVEKNNSLISAGLSATTATVIYSSIAAGTAQLTISNILGEPVINSTITLEKGTNDLHIDFPVLSKGIYVVTLNFGDKVESLKAIFQ